MIRKDLTNKKFNRLTVINFHSRVNSKAKWLCICECGNKTIVDGYQLKNGGVKSCGCLARELLSERRKKHICRGCGNHTEEKHYGVAICSECSRIYNIWCGMKSRCINNTSGSYHKYGAIGISVCKEWICFDNFFQWAISNGYKDYLTIDRINNALGYSPENCRWATYSEQNRNRRPYKHHKTKIK